MQAMRCMQTRARADNHERQCKARQTPMQISSATLASQRGTQYTCHCKPMIMGEHVIPARPPLRYGKIDVYPHKPTVQSGMQPNLSHRKANTCIPIRTTHANRCKHRCKQGKRQRANKCNTNVTVVATASSIQCTHQCERICLHTNVNQGMPGQEPLGSNVHKMPTIANRCNKNKHTKKDTTRVNVYISSHFISVSDGSRG